MRVFWLCLALCAGCFDYEALSEGRRALQLPDGASSADAGAVDAALANDGALPDEKDGAVTSTDGATPPHGDASMGQADGGGTAHSDFATVPSGDMACECVSGDSRQCVNGYTQVCTNCIWGLCEF